MRLTKNPSNGQVTIVLEDDEVDSTYEIMDVYVERNKGNLDLSEGAALAAKICDELDKTYKRSPKWNIEESSKIEA